MLLFNFINFALAERLLESHVDFTGPSHLIFTGSGLHNTAVVPVESTLLVTIIRLLWRFQQGFEIRAISEQQDYLESCSLAHPPQACNSPSARIIRALFLSASACRQLHGAYFQGVTVRR